MCIFISTKQLLQVPKIVHWIHLTKGKTVVPDIIHIVLLVVILSMLDNSCEFHIIKKAFRIHRCSMEHVINFLV